MSEDNWRDQIDDYLSSIHAIVGFANFYLWDPATKSDRAGMTVFQGRRLRIATEEGVEDGPSLATYVTPDLGVVSGEKDGVLAEVKLSFPKNEEHWFDDFQQLMSYDKNLDGWPTSDGRVKRHDVVLITEQSRVSKVRKFFEKHRGDRIRFDRPFILVSCNRSDNRQPYYFFQAIIGVLTNESVKSQLDDGTKVPMRVLIDKYSTIKLYDAQPPLPYMIELIWTQVVLDNARLDPKFTKLRKRQKLAVVLDVDDIVTRLREGFTFRAFDSHASEGTPAMPHRSWVINALEQLISLREAEWIDATKTSVRVFFQMYEDALDHFIKGCVAHAGKISAPQELQRPLNFSDE